MGILGDRWMEETGAFTGIGIFKRSRLLETLEAWTARGMTMARPLWTGHITFGLVNIPVNLYPAEQRSDLQLHLLDSRDQARIRYERVNEDTGEEVPWSSVVHGYEVSDGNYVVLKDSELKNAAPEVTKTIDIESFVAAEEIDPIYYDRPYYLDPGKGGAKGYALLREALTDSQRAGIARVVIRTRQYIAGLFARPDYLLLILLRYSQELRKPDELQGLASLAGVRVSPAERKTAAMLVREMTTKWKPEIYQDEYRQRLMDYIRERAEKGGKGLPPALQPETASGPTAPLNFMELLKRSLAGRKPKGLPSPPQAQPPKASATGEKPVPKKKKPATPAGKSAPAPAPNRGKKKAV